MMTLTKRGKIFLICAAISLLISFLSITKMAFGFPYFGIGFSLVLIASFVYFLKYNKTPTTKLYYFFTIFFSVLIFVRSEGFITLINFVTALFFGSLMVFPKKSNGLFELLFSPITTIFKSLTTKNDYYLEYVKSDKPKKGIKILEVGTGILISILLLSVIIPLLSSTNPIFNNLVLNIFKNLNIQNLLNFFSFENIFINLIRFGFTVFLLILLPKMATSSNQKTEDDQFVLNINLIVPKILVSLVLAIFFVTQLQLYFSSETTLVQMGYSYSQYTREVFGQLSLVTIIIFLVVYLDKSLSKFGKILSYILLIQTGLLTCMAFKSVYEYSQKWGFTYLRLYGFSIVAWCIGTLIMFIQSVKNSSRRTFISKIILWTGIVIALINLSNFDFLIYNIRKSSTGQGVDYQYLSKLSSDSLSFQDQPNEIYKIVNNQKLSPDDYWKYSSSGNRLIIKIENLKRKYENFDLRTFNFFDYIQYLKIKDFKTEDLTKTFNKEIIYTN